MYNLLLVDDEVLIADGMYDVLCEEGAENLMLMKAYSVEEARVIAKSNRIDILLTDINMPDQDGFELYEEMIKMWPHCRVIFLTGFERFDYAYQALQYRNIYYIIKAEGVDKVLSVVAEVVRELDSDAGIPRMSEHQKNSDNANLIIAKVEALVEADLENGICLAEIAQKLHFNLYYLSRLFKNEKGISLSDYITNQKMERAKKLLKESDIKVQTIGERMGYSSPANFIRGFKKYTGVTPNEYRREY